MCEDYLKTMDEFSTLCLTTEAKINVFIKMNKLVEKVNLFEVLECMEEYKAMDENQSKTLTNIKEEIEIDIDELKPHVGRFVIMLIIIIYFISSVITFSAFTSLQLILPSCLLIILIVTIVIQ